MIVAGFGFRAAATLASLQDAFAQVGGQAQALAAPADKAAAARGEKNTARVRLPWPEGATMVLTATVRSSSGSRAW